MNWRTRSQRRTETRLTREPTLERVNRKEDVGVQQEASAWQRGAKVINQEGARGRT
jgi:hypothetical protein